MLGVESGGPVWANSENIVLWLVLNILAFFQRASSLPFSETFAPLRNLSRKQQKN